MFQNLLTLILSFFGFDLSGLWTAIGRYIGLPLTIAIIAMVGAGTSGCSAQHWLGTQKTYTHFSASYGPAHMVFEDTKDNDVELKGAEYDPSTRHFKIESLKILNRATEPIQANGQLALATAQGQMSQVAYLAQVGGTVSQIIGAVGSAAGPILHDYFARLPSQQSSGFNLTGPGGIGFGTSNSTRRDPFGPAASQPAPAPVPASQ